MSKPIAIGTSKRKLAKPRPEYNLTTKIALGARILYDQGQSSVLTAQISCRETVDDSAFRMRTIRYGIGLDEVRQSELLLVDALVETAEGDGVANSLLLSHAYLYFARPNVRCIIHTHPPYVNALGLAGKGLVVDHIDSAVYDDLSYVGYWPDLHSPREEGEFLTEQLANNSAIILAHHGLLVVGNSIEEATYRAYNIEELAKLQFTAQQLNPHLLRANASLARRAKDVQISPAAVTANFNYLARRVLRSPQHTDALH